MMPVVIVMIVLVCDPVCATMGATKGVCLAFSMHATPRTNVLLPRQQTSAAIDQGRLPMQLRQT